MTDPKKPASVSIQVERTHPAPIGEQIYMSLHSSIREGILAAGSRLPSDRALAAQLGVARGTIRVAYDRLADEGLIFGAGSSGTWVCSKLPPMPSEHEEVLDRPLAGFTRPYSSAPLPFQVGVPAHDAFPFKTWERMRARAVRADALSYTTYADPRGEPGLRSQIAGHLAVSRQIQCHPDQIIVTSGYRSGLMLTLTALQASGQKAWMEEPGYPLGRRVLELAGLTVEPIPVDAEGLRVEEGITRASDALVALVTPGQQAPLGVTLSPKRRRDLLGWAETQSAWIIEDDYLGELQIDGRATPALASGEGAQRVIHIGTFSKTMSPSLGLGFVVVPKMLTEQFVEIAAVMLPAPNRTTQLAVAEFLADGHFLRHLRQMKDLYCERRACALTHLSKTFPVILRSGLGLVACLPETANDAMLVSKARELGLAPSALSLWYTDATHAKRGFILSITNLRADSIGAACAALNDVIAAQVKA
ncbi:PLP-dependent aminotransferase family protein [Imbroritus primus]|uniref:PLP-dependent aminotransferase family protein n=1 Tax=Imbroritus primus TaxID=3058603 RepID=A0ACD3SSV0_9BURK|nr:PLP-dependent aminotransferase family protein [Burkholderiaceae bacterium PBA]